MTITPKLGINLLATNTAQKEIVINEALVSFDAIIGGSVLAIQNGPPASPADGDAYIVGTAPTGAWTGHENDIAFWFNGWRFIDTIQKMRMWVMSPGAFFTRQVGSWTQDPAGAATQLGDLTDVDGSTPLNGYILRFNDTTGMWEPSPLEVSSDLADLGDVSLSSPAAGHVLVYDAVTQKWKNQAIETGGGASSFAELSDVEMGTAAPGRLASWSNDSKLVFVKPEDLLTVPSLGRLGDVTTEGAQPNDVLAWNGATWAPSPAVITYSFLGMVDGPQTFEGYANHFLVVDPTESQMEFRSLDDLLNVSQFRLQALGDMPTDPLTDADVNKVVQVYKQGTNNYRFRYASLPDWKVSVLNGETQLTDRLLSLKFEGFDIEEPSEGNVVVKAANVLEFQANGEPLTDFPVHAINFTGVGVGATNDNGTIVVTVTAGGVELNELTDVDFSTPPTDKQALVFDALSQKWKPGAAPGGSLPEIDGLAEPATYEMGPFAPPTPAMLPDKFNTTNPVMMAVPNRGLVFQPGPQGNGVRHCLATRTVTNNLAPWRFTARVVPTSFEASGHAAGICVQRATNNAMVFLVLGNSNTDTQFSIRFGHVSAAGAETITLTEPNQYNWLRLDYDGNNINASVSSDGLIWHHFGSLGAAAVLGGPPTKIGLDNRTQSGTDGDAGMLVTYWEDPDFPAASRTQQGVVSLSLNGLNDVDVSGSLTDGQALVWSAANERWEPGNPVGSGGGGAEFLYELEDVDVTTSAPQAGQALIWDDLAAKWVPGAQVGGAGPVEVDISLFIPGVPEADEIVARYVAVRDFTLPASLVGSRGWTDVEPAAPVVFALKKNGVDFGTVEFAPGSQAGSFAAANQTTFAAGDRLDIVSPVSVLGVSDLGITFAGSR